MLEDDVTRAAPKEFNEDAVFLCGLSSDILVLGPISTLESSYPEYRLVNELTKISIGMKSAMDWSILRCFLLIADDMVSN